MTEGKATEAEAIAAWNTRLLKEQPAGDDTETALHFVCDGPPGPEGGRFVECETPDGRSVSAGEWHERPDGYWELRVASRLSIPSEVTEGWQSIETAPKDGTRIIVGWRERDQVRGVSAAKWVTAEFWADLEGGEPEEFQAGWYEPNYEDELCANVWTPMPAMLSSASLGE